MKSDLTNARLRGVIPPATTPFTETGRIDLAAAHEQISWLIDQGVHGVVVGGSTGEGHTLEAEEFRDLVVAAVEAASNRIPVLGGVIVDSTRDAIRRGKAVAELGLVALQVTPVHYLFRPDDDAMLSYFREICEETGHRVIIYNVVPWSYLSPVLLCRIMDEVEGVVGVKQSAGDLKLLADLIHMADPAHLILSAVDALIYPSYVLGAHGSVAAILSAAPGASVELWNAVQENDHPRALDIHTKLLALWNAIDAPNLPACVKYAQSLQGCPACYPRSPMSEATEEQRKRIRAALDSLRMRP